MNLVKKILKTVDNFTDAEQICLKPIYKIQEMRNSGYSISEISRLLGKDIRTIKMYIQGDQMIYVNILEKEITHMKIK